MKIKIRFYNFVNGKIVLKDKWLTDRHKFLPTVWRTSCEHWLLEKTWRQEKIRSRWVLAPGLELEDVFDLYTCIMYGDWK